MKGTALTLGIIAGVIGILAGILEIATGGAASALDADGGGTVAGMGFVTFFLAVAGIVGGVRSASGSGWILMLLAGIGGFVTAGLFWLLSGPLFIVGAGFAFAARRETAKAHGGPPGLPTSGHGVGI
jgi:hypothetical protein